MSGRVAGWDVTAERLLPSSTASLAFGVWVWSSDLEHLI